MVDSISGLNKLELITAAAFPVGYPSSKITGDLLTQLNAYYDEGLIDICSKYDFRFTRASASLSLTSGSRTYSLSSNSLYVKHVDSIFLTDSAYARKLSKRSYTILKDVDPEASDTGTPNFYAEWGGETLYFDTAPDTTLNAVMLYTRIPAMVMSSSGYSIIPRQHQHVHQKYIRYRLCEDKNDRRMMAFKAAYDQAIQEMIVSEQNELESENYYGEEPVGGKQATMDDYLRAWFR